MSISFWKTTPEHTSQKYEEACINFYHALRDQALGDNPLFLSSHAVWQYWEKRHADLGCETLSLNDISALAQGDTAMKDKYHQSCAEPRLFAQEYETQNKDHFRRLLAR